MQYFCRRCGAAVIFIYLTILCCEASDASAQRTPRKPFVHNAQFWRRIFYTYTSCTNMTAKYPAAAEIPIFLKFCRQYTEKPLTNTQFGLIIYYD